MRKVKFIFATAIVLTSLQVVGQEVEKIQVGSTEISIASPTIKDSLYNELQAEHHVKVRRINTTLYHVAVSITPTQTISPSDIVISTTVSAKGSSRAPELEKYFHWVPNIKSAPDQIISQHVFRSPCVILTMQENAVAVIPDLKKMKKKQVAPYYLDLIYKDGGMTVKFGLSNYNVVNHQYYTKSKQPFSLSGKIDIAFYVLISSDPAPLATLEKTNDFLWKTFASEYTSSILPQTIKFSDYANVAYPMALNHYWVDVAEEKGGITLSTFYDEVGKVYRGRYYRDDLWFHSWFNNMRTAYGLYYWGNAKSDDQWKQKAISTANLLLECPVKNGWFPTIFAGKENGWIESGQGGGRGIYHVPDNAWTAYWLMRFNDEQHRVEGCDKFVRNFSKALLKVQAENGSFPARVNAVSLKADSILEYSASSAISTWYLLEMLLKNKVATDQLPVYKSAIRRSLDFIEKEVLPRQRFDDFELYFSCSPKPMFYYDSSTYMYGQNTLAIQWCAEAYLKAFQLFKDKRYLQNGEYCLNILSLYQQIWNPPFINLYGFGGFGVQNTDAEWSDARQAQFAETYLNFYEVTGKKEYLERALSACRASFALMVIPENKEVCPANYAGTEINGESFKGTMAENYGHSGFDERSHQSGFHWGSGSALTSAAIFDHRLGKKYSLKSGKSGRLAAQ